MILVVGARFEMIRGKKDMLINGGCRFVCGVFVIGLVFGFLLCFWE